MRTQDEIVANLRAYFAGTEPLSDCDRYRRRNADRALKAGGGLTDEEFDKLLELRDTVS